MKTLRIIVILMVALLAGCNGQSDEPVVQQLPTATLQPIPTLTPRVTATQESTRTPLPTFTFTPTQTDIPPTATLSPTPTMTPTVSGIVSSLQAVNVREGPGVEYNILTAINPGTGVQVVGRNEEGNWLNVRLEDGREGWMSTRLVRVQPTATPFPTHTPTVDLTSIALGTVFPTAVLGGGSVTPTPPRQVRTPTPSGETTQDPEEGEAIEEGEEIPNVRVVSPLEIYQTATALAGGVFIPTEPPAVDTTGSEGTDTERIITVAPQATDDNPQTSPATITPIPTVDIAAVDGRDVFAFCDNTSYGIPRPPVLNNGDVIDIWWAWLAGTEEQVQEHIDAVSYELRVNGELIEVLPGYMTELRQQGALWAAYWYVPFGPLEPGDYEITHVMTWERAVFDGSDNFGPGTDNPFVQETCSFTVR